MILPRTSTLVLIQIKLNLYKNGKLSRLAVFIVLFFVIYMLKPKTLIRSPKFITTQSRMTKRTK